MNERDVNRLKPKKRLGKLKRKARLGMIVPMRGDIAGKGKGGIEERKEQ